MPFMTFIKDPKQILRIITATLFTTGSALTTYNLFAFRVDKYGFYFKDADQFWLAIGVGMLLFGWIIKNWKSIQNLLDF